MKLPENILILAPHPDDETLMAAGLIRRALAQGALVNVCVVTNGDHLCPDKSKGRRRLQESLNALRLLGVDERNVHFLGYPDTGFDGTCTATMPPCCASLAKPQGALRKSR